MSSASKPDPTKKADDASAKKDKDEKKANAAASSSSSSSSAASSNATASAGTSATTPAVAGLDDGSGSDGDEVIELVSKEQKKFRVSKRAATISTLVRTAIENDRDAKEVPLIHIESPIVEKIVQYMNYHVTVRTTDCIDWID